MISSLLLPNPFAMAYIHTHSHTHSLIQEYGRRLGDGSSFFFFPIRAADEEGANYVNGILL